MALDSRLALGRIYLRLLRQNLLRIDRLSAALIEPHGLTNQQFLALLLIRDNDGLTQVELTNQLDSDQNTISAVVRRLEKRGFVTRERHPTDGRAFRLLVTSEGDTIVAETQLDVDKLSLVLEELTAPADANVIIAWLQQVAWLANIKCSRVARSQGDSKIGAIGMSSPHCRYGPYDRRDCLLRWRRNAQFVQPRDQLRHRSHKPKDAPAFERLCTDLFEQLLDDVHTDQHGRNGQGQKGVDLYGTDRASEVRVGVECKKRSQRAGSCTAELTVGELDKIVARARAFLPPRSASWC